MINSELIENIAYLTISSGKGNLIGIEDLRSLLTIVEQSVKNEEVKSLVVRGENKCFSTGLKVGDLNEKELSPFFYTFEKLLMDLFTFPKPLIVALTGHSIGGGLLIQCCADYVISLDSEKLKIGLPEVKMGLSVDAFMIALLEFNILNIRNLQQLLYCGDYINVTQAKALNLIDEVVSFEELEHVVKQIAYKLQSYNAKAFGITKLGLRKTTIERMKNVFENNCFELFCKLNKR